MLGVLEARIEDGTQKSVTNFLIPGKHRIKKIINKLQQNKIEKIYYIII